MAIRMAIEGNAAAVQVGEGAVLPVVGVGVRQQHRLDRRPGGADRGQPVGELARPQAGVDEHAEAVDLHQTGVAAAAAGQHREPQTHAVDLFAKPTPQDTKNIWITSHLVILCVLCVLVAIFVDMAARIRPEVGPVEHAHTFLDESRSRPVAGFRPDRTSGVPERHVLGQDAAEEVGLGQHLDVDERPVRLERDAGEDLAAHQAVGAKHVAVAHGEQHAGQQPGGVAVDAEPARQRRRGGAEHDPAEDAASATPPPARTSARVGRPGSR